MKSSELSPTALVIFGITGDLSRKKLLPALYHLAHDRLLPQQFKIIGISRRTIDLSALLKSIEEQVKTGGGKCDPATLDALGKFIQPLQIDIAEPEAYDKLKSALDRLEDDQKLCYNRLFYLSIPPQVIGPVVDYLGKSKLNEGCQHNRAVSRLLIEKPFGYDLESARDLIQRISRHFSEKQVYRIDHYLAKETAQNILTFRFQNPLFEGVWNNQFIDHILITAAETIGIEGRVAFYQQTGALRDIIQSHLLQLMALVMMDNPQTSKDGIHSEKLKLMQSIQKIAPDEVESQTVRGQYEGYRSEVNEPDSSIETYAALKLEVDNDRWRGVPVLLRTGKQLAEKVTEITMVFRDRTKRQVPANLLTIRIQPDEGIALELLAKKPGFDTETQPVQMDFCYHRSFDSLHPDAYERIFMDAVRGDQTLFSTSDEVLAAWELLDPIIKNWAANDSQLETYKPQSWGPKAGDVLAKHYNSEWVSHQLQICSVHVLQK